MLGANLGCISHGDVSVMFLHEIGKNHSFCHWEYDPIYVVKRFTQLKKGYRLTFTARTSERFLLDI